MPEKTPPVSPHWLTKARAVDFRGQFSPHPLYLCRLPLYLCRIPLYLCRIPLYLCRLPPTVSLPPPTVSLTSSGACRALSKHWHQEMTVGHSPHAHFFICCSERPQHATPSRHAAHTPHLKQRGKNNPRVSYPISLWGAVCKIIHKIILYL